MWSANMYNTVRNLVFVTRVYKSTCPTQAVYSSHIPTLWVFVRWHPPKTTYLATHDKFKQLSVSEGHRPVKWLANRRPHLIFASACSMQVSVEDRTVSDEGIMCYRVLLVVFICASNLIYRSVTIIAAKLGMVLNTETDHLDFYFVMAVETVICIAFDTQAIYIYIYTTCTWQCRRLCNNTTPSCLLAVETGIIHLYLQRAVQVGIQDAYDVERPVSSAHAYAMLVGDYFWRFFSVCTTKVCFASCLLLVWSFP